MTKTSNLAWKSLEIMAAELAATKVGRLRILQEFEERLQKEKLFVCHHHMGTTRMASSEEMAWLIVIKKYLTPITYISMGAQYL